LKTGKLTREIIFVETVEALAEEGVRFFTEVVEGAVEARGRCMVALSGGSTPRKMHALLAQKPYCSGIPWSKVHLCWGDERCVPADSRWSNYGRAREDLLDNIDIPIGNVHPMPGHLLPEEGALRYEKEIPEAFDLVFLGLGADGHTASLFPGHSALEERKRRVVPVTGGDPDVPRLTITFPVINKARNVVFLVSGKEKAEMVKSVIEDHEPHLPASHVLPASGSLTWMLDREAATLLSKETIGA
jgi:6-phosphogluconolactonase